MNTRIVGARHLVAATGAAVITTVSAWAFVSSTASSERDPFQFASIMAANAKAHVALAYSRAASTCPNNPEVQDYRTPECMRG